MKNKSRINLVHLIRSGTKIYRYFTFLGILLFNKNTILNDIIEFSTLEIDPNLADNQVLLS